MENKEFRNALVIAIKNELKDFTQVQRDLKKSRKLQYRPKDRSLQDIVDEINNNASKISILIYYYRWIKHGLKYWANRDIYDYWDYQHVNPYGSYPDSYRNQKVWWSREQGSVTTTYEEYVKGQFENYFINLIEKYKIELSNTEIDELIEYLYKNI